VLKPYIRKHIFITTLGNYTWYIDI